MTKPPVNLWLRHRTWFLRLSIPPSLRHHFGGKDKIVESLGTDSLSEAERERDRRVAEYHARFERLRTGADPTGEEIAAIARGVFDRTAARRRPPQPLTEDQRAKMDRLLDWAIQTSVASEMAEAAKKLRVPLEPGTPLYRQLGQAIIEARMAAG